LISEDVKMVAAAVWNECRGRFLVKGKANNLES